MQAVLNQLVTKSREANLTFSPEKTVAMMFSQKKENCNKTLHRGKKTKNGRRHTIPGGNHRQHTQLDTTHKSKNRSMQHAPENNNKKNKFILWTKTQINEMGLHRNNKTQIHLRGPSVGT